jgi:hypothetical protein
MVIHTGMAIAPPIFQKFSLLPEIGMEILYSFVIIVCSLMIYYGTKELYELSSHKGIKYFRRAFLFFAIAYLFRSGIKFLVSYFEVNRFLDIPSRAINPFIGRFTLFIFLYFSSMAIFYLLYSVMWKEWKNPKKFYIFHLIALILSLASVSYRNPIVYLITHLLLLIVIIGVVFIAYKNSSNRKKSYDLYAIYVLLSVFWLLNLLDIFIPIFLETAKLLIYVISAGLFLMMVYKVLRKTS